MGAALPAASAASGSRARQPLQPGILAAKSRHREIAAQATAAEPGGERTAGPSRAWPRWWLGAALRFARLSLGSRHLKEDKLGAVRGGRVLANLVQAFKIGTLKA